MVIYAVISERQFFEISIVKYFVHRQMAEEMVKKLNKIYTAEVHYVRDIEVEDTLPVSLSRGGDE
jgi:abortive infection bacteriophage resistance protein